MRALQHKVGCLGCVVLALACAEPGDDGLSPGSGGADSMGGAAGKGVAGLPSSSSGRATSGGAGAAFGGSAGSGASGGGGSSGSGQANGGQATSGGIGGADGGRGGRAGVGGDANSGGAVSRGGVSAGGGRGGSAGAAGSSQGGISGGAAGSSPGGASSVGGTGSCVEELACTLAAPPATADLHQDCVDRINQFRTQCACLPALARWPEGEACADQMAEYDAMQDVAHAGFEDGICDSGRGGQNECPGYSSNAQVISLCLQQMWSEGPGPQDPCNGQCFQDHGHFINMTSTTMTKVACGFSTTSSGKVWAVQNFSR